MLQQASIHTQTKTKNLKLAGRFFCTPVLQPFSFEFFFRTFDISSSQRWRVRTRALGRAVGCVLKERVLCSIAPHGGWSFVLVGASEMGYLLQHLHRCVSFHRSTNLLHMLVFEEIVLKAAEEGLCLCRDNAKCSASSGELIQTCLCCPPQLGRKWGSRYYPRSHPGPSSSTDCCCSMVIGAKSVALAVVDGF
jgi:hypothetical protein